ncbi:uncharacterized protein LOC124596569 isoform X1 [Schistocerca americana]|uniref:uncharacterized protein LOC124596569 isoform X1 n=1 Tax=Schistocerca americana TaxID=7009 RepID=UPI001F4FBE73|nr:uncharacterized protein LOC124596569 isoform X1 [Schistocerca americana]
MARCQTLPLLLALAACVCFLPGGAALRCYHCYSSEDSTCGDPFLPGSVPLVDCSHPQQMCAKITYYAESRDWVERRCAFMGGSGAWRSGHVYTCGEDGCNMAGRATGQALLLLLLLLMAAVTVW